MRKPIVMLMATTVWLSLLCLRVQAQQPSGSISGLVEDSSGAIIPQARITIKRESTGEIHELAVNAAGLFLLPGLVPDVYQVKVEAGGFNSVQQGCLVEVGRVTSLKFQLAVGNLNQVVEVAAQSVQVNTVQSSLEGIVTGQSIRSLPLNGGNFLDLGQLEPGIQL